jgi:hypothetical protein
MVPWLEKFGVPDPDNVGKFLLPSSRESLVVSILSAGTFFGALLGAPAADHLGRKWVCVCPAWSVTSEGSDINLIRVSSVLLLFSPLV